MPLPSCLSHSAFSAFTTPLLAPPLSPLLASVRSPFPTLLPAGEGNLEALGAALNGGEAPAREEIVIPPIVDVNDDVPKR